MVYTHLQDVRKTHSMKDLREIHDRAVLAVDKLKSCEAELILVLQEVDDKLVHRFLGYNSVYQYALQALHLSESQACAYITVARKAREFPALQEAVENGELSVSKATRITKIIDDKSQTKWVELAKTLPRAELEREVAAVSPRAVMHERVQFLNSTTLEMSLPISEEGFKEIERARELLSSNLGHAVSLEETVVAIAQFFNKHNDPVLKADRAVKRKEKTKQKAQAKEQHSPIRKSDKSDTTDASSTEAANSPSDSLPGKCSNTQHNVQKPSQRISASLRHKANHRDRGECQERMPDGSICGERKWIDLHHIQPRAMGGRDELENLVTLCKAHHQARH